MMQLNINKNTSKKLICFLLATAAVGQAYAQLQLSKYTINNGGNVMTGDGYEVRSSIGQVDANTPSSSGDITLNAGFWHGNTDLIFKNKFQ